MNTQISATWYRGGTSKCWFFDAAAVEASGHDVSTVLASAFGASDARQIDGVGGATSTTSKAAVITPTPGADADLTYLFAQVGIGDGRVEYGSNCGNCASAVGLYALQSGIVAPTGDVTDVRMFNENSDTTLVARVQTPGGEVPFTGEETIPGHQAPGVRGDLAFERPSGRSPGRLRPTGNALDELADDSGLLMRATLIDAGAPACLIPAADLGLTATELPVEFAASVPELKRWQRLAALAMGLATPEDPISDAIPKVGVVGAPLDYVALDGTEIAASDYDIAVRMVSMHAPHPAIGITSAVAVAAAGGVEGSTVARILSAWDGNARERTIRLGTPVGVIETAITLDEHGDAALVSTKRVARRIAAATIDLALA